MEVDIFHPGLLCPCFGGESLGYVMCHFDRICSFLSLLLKAVVHQDPAGLFRASIVLSLISRGVKYNKPKKCELE